MFRVLQRSHFIHSIKYQYFGMKFVVILGKDMKFIFFLWMFSLHHWLLGQYKSNLNIKINVAPPIYTEERITIPFDITYAGLVEFNIYEKTKRIWVAEMLCEKGDTSISFKATKLIPGTTYDYFFVYKGKKVNGQLRRD